MNTLILEILPIIKHNNLIHNNKIDCIINKLNLLVPQLITPQMDSQMDSLIEQSSELSLELLNINNITNILTTELTTDLLNINNITNILTTELTTDLLNINNSTNILTPELTTDLLNINNILIPELTTDESYGYGFQSYSFTLSSDELQPTGIAPSLPMILHQLYYIDNIVTNNIEIPTMEATTILSAINPNAINNTNLDNLELINNSIIDNNDNDNECLICYDILDDKDASTLTCGHKFHNQCVILSYQHAGNTQCPYCRNVNGALPKKLCSAILKTGKNKGKSCNVVARYGNLCKRHNK